MTDLATIKIPVNTSDIPKALREVSRLETTVDNLHKAFKSGAADSSVVNRGLAQMAKELQRLGLSYNQANSQVRKYFADLQRMDLAAQTAKLAQRQQELRMRFQEGYAAFTRTRQHMRDLREAYRLGIITLAEYKRQLELVRQAHVNQGQHVNQAKLEMNRLGVVTQQAGYQIGDFLVQVQSGTNIMVAFGQQATQLVGTFAMLARTTRNIAIFSALGVIIPILTAVGATLMRASGAADTLAQSAEKLKTSTDRLGESFEILNDEELSSTFGSMTDEVSSLTGAMLELERAAQMKQLSSFIGKMESSAKAGFFRQMGEGALNIARFVDPFSSMKGPAQVDEEAYQKLGFQMARSTYLGYMSELNKLANAGNTEGVVELFDKFIQDATDSGTAAGKVSAKGFEQAFQIKESALALAEVVALMNGSAKAAEEAAEKEKERTKELEKRAELLEKINRQVLEDERNYQEFLNKRFLSFEQEKKLLVDQLNLGQTILKTGEDSAAVRGLQLAIARQAYEEELRQKNLTGLQIEQLMDLYDENVRVTNQLERSKEGAEKLADALKDASSAMNSLRSFSEGLDKSIAQSVAKIAALKSGADAAIAGNIAGLRFDLESKMSDARAAGVDPSIVERMFGGDRQKISRLEALENERKALEGSGRGSSRVGSSARQEDLIAKLEQEIQLKERLIGLDQQEREFLEVKSDIISQLGDQVSKLTEEQIEGYARRQIAAEESLNRQIELENKLQEAREFAANSMTNLFMSAVKGGEAFMQTLSQIILELARMAAQEAFMRMMGTASGANPGTFLGALLGFKNGGAFSGGRVIPFANGGVVSSPTNFPMAGNNMGLMGEAGPEAIIPLRRGSNGKLGVESPAPVVNQKIINVLDPSIVGDYLATDSGEKVIMNVLRKNGVTGR